MATEQITLDWVDDDGYTTKTEFLTDTSDEAGAAQALISAIRACSYAHIAKAYKRDADTSFTPAVAVAGAYDASDKVITSYKNGQIRHNVQVPAPKVTLFTDSENMAPGDSLLAALDSAVNYAAAGAYGRRVKAFRSKRHRRNLHTSHT